MAKAASKPLTKSEIIDHLAKTVEGVTKKQTTQFLNGLVDLAYKNAKKSFTIPGLGKVYTIRKKARMGRNPSSGEPLKIPAKSVVKFKVSKTAQDAVYPPKK